MPGSADSLDWPDIERIQAQLGILIFDVPRFLKALSKEKNHYSEYSYSTEGS